MDFTNKNFKKPANEIVNFEKLALGVTDAVMNGVVIDTSRHLNVAIFLATKNANAVKYVVEVANVDESGVLSGWSVLEPETVLAGNDQVVFTSNCVAERMRLTLANNVGAALGEVDIFVRLNPVGSII